MAPPVCHIKLQQQHVRPRAAQPRLSSNHSALQAISPHTANYKKDRNNVQPDLTLKIFFPQILRCFSSIGVTQP